MRRGQGRSFYVLLDLGGVEDAIRAASGEKERRAGRCNPFERYALVRNERFSDPQGDDDAR
jgi:hypothetical protein